MNMQPIAETLAEHALHMISPVTDDPNGPWAVECDCDYVVTSSTFHHGERAHAAHQAQQLAPVLEAMIAQSEND